MRVGVEAGCAGLLHRAQERQGRHRRPARVRVVVAARPGDPARDLRGANGGLPDALHDRVADLGVVDRALDHELATDTAILRPEKGRVVRLVPREPVPHSRKCAPVGGLERPAVTARGGRREALEIESVLRHDVDTRSPVRPGRRPHDREHDLDSVRLRVLHRAVVHRPVVGRIVRVHRVHRPSLGDAVRAAPDEVDPDHLRPQLLQHRKDLIGVSVVELRVVEEPDLEIARRARCGHAENCGRDEGGRNRSDAPRQRSVPSAARSGVD